MNVIYLLIPLSVAVAAAFLGAFLWAVRSGQYDDTATPPLRLLIDDPTPRRETSPRSISGNEFKRSGCQAASPNNFPSTNETLNSAHEHQR